MARLLAPRVFFVAALLAALAALLLPLAAPPASAEAPVTGDRAQAAAGWLARQMVNGERFETTYDGTIYADYGLTIDALLAFAATGVADTQGASALAWLSQPANVGGYIGTGSDTYAGATAKLLYAVAVRGGDYTSIGGVNLEQRLRGLLAASGRLSDASAFGDYSNVFTQSLALVALTRTSAGVPSSAAAFLAAAQCGDGGFPSAFGTTPCSSDVDATAMAAQGLRAAGDTTNAGEALAYLEAHQGADGGFAAAGATSSNANTTGLATAALRSAGHTSAADKAVAYLTALQLGCSAEAGQRGAVPFAAGPLDGTAPRATAQAVLGLTGADLATLSAANATAEPPTLECAAPTPTVTTPASATPSVTPPAATTQAPSETVVIPSALRTSVAAPAAVYVPSGVRAPAIAPRTPGLARTGSATAPLAWSALALALVGAALVLAARVRPAAPTASSE
jgi:hypothetical protein